ncbi:hypothetical protein IFR05_015605 [Cadophora sp. M221]|nr:hypothetical protein IFR05_015605 [Cadophora sp. M221]
MVSAILFKCKKAFNAVRLQMDRSNSGLNTHSGYDFFPPITHPYDGKELEGEASEVTQDWIPRSHVVVLYLPALEATHFQPLRNAQTVTDQHLQRLWRHFSYYNQLSDVRRPIDIINVGDSTNMAAFCATSVQC